MMEAFYWYCVDFCINAANALGFSYAAFNFWLFTVGMPLGVVLLLLANFLLRKRGSRFTGNRGY